jgi:hypothetical protein
MRTGEAASNTSRHRSLDATRQLARMLLGDYQIYRIYELDLSLAPQVDLTGLANEGYECCEVSQEEVLAALDDDVRSRAFYGGEGTLGFAIRAGREIVCLQWYWFGDRYRQRRNFWPLQDGEAKSIELFSVAAHRGKGLATALKGYSALEMRKRGFRKLFSRIWHTHTASRRVSEKAGWRNIALVAEIYPLGMPKKVRFVRRL